MNMGGNGQLSVPPGFRFHPTDEELLYYYLMKKVSYEPIDLDVIREVDLNKLEPWDLKENCRIGTGPQNEWYFFSHKDKKYPTGTRTNRATTAGFWKATGRDKPIHLANSKRIGMRKTLVFYTGRAPHGQKTDWIMHEYRLDDHANSQLQEDGWVVCRVFKKKNHNRPNFQAEDQEDEHLSCETTKHGLTNASCANLEPRQSHILDNYSFDLPQLFSPESAVAAPCFISPAAATVSLNTMDIECSHNLLRLTSTGSGLVPQHGGDWSFLDKLLASSSSSSSTSFHHGHQLDTKSQLVDLLPTSSASKFPFQYLVNQPDFFKFNPK